MYYKTLKKIDIKETNTTYGIDIIIHESNLKGLDINYLIENKFIIDVDTFNFNKSLDYEIQKIKTIIEKFKEDNIIITIDSAVQIRTNILLNNISKSVEWLELIASNSGGENLDDYNHHIA